MRELTLTELDDVSGAGWTQALGAWGTAAYVGTSTFGTSWATVGALTAIGISPVSALAMVGLAFYGGYQLLQE